MKAHAFFCGIAILTGLSCADKSQHTYDTGSLSTEGTSEVAGTITLPSTSSGTTTATTTSGGTSSTTTSSTTGGTTTGGTTTGGTTGSTTTGTTTGGTTGGTTGSTTGTTKGFSPRVGKWLYDSLVLVSSSNNCSVLISIIGDMPDHYKINRADTVSFDTLSDFYSSNTCNLGEDPDGTLNPQAYICDEVNDSVVPSKNYDLTLDITFNAWGEFADDENDAGNYDIHIECTGPDCATAEALGSFTFPCDFVYEYVSARE